MSTPAIEPEIKYEDKVYLWESAPVMRQMSAILTQRMLFHSSTTSCLFGQQCTFKLH